MLACVSLRPVPFSYTRVSNYWLFLVNPSFGNGTAPLPRKKWAVEVKHLFIKVPVLLYTAVPVQLHGSYDAASAGKDQFYSVLGGVAAVHQHRVVPISYPH